VLRGPFVVRPWFQSPSALEVMEAASAGYTGEGEGGADVCHGIQVEWHAHDVAARARSRSILVQRTTADARILLAQTCRSVR
jgi:hypothetical protein